MKTLNLKDCFEAQNRVSQEAQKILDAPKKAVFEFQDRQARSLQEIQKFLDDQRRIRESFSSSLSGLPFLS